MDPSAIVFQAIREIEVSRCLPAISRPVLRKEWLAICPVMDWSQSLSLSIG